MVGKLSGWTLSRPAFRTAANRGYRGSEPLVLVNGLAEQSESWFANRAYWHRYFDVHAPELLVYDGDPLHRHVKAGGEVDVDYLTGRLAFYLDEFVQRPPYNLVGSSLGGQVALTYAVRNPEKVARLVLICPSGLRGNENLPVVDGVRRSEYGALVESVFHSKQFATRELVETVTQKLQNRRWKKGALRALRGTVGHSVAGLLEEVAHPCFVIWGAEDRVISDVAGSIREAERLPHGRQVVISGCGHAPQIEKSRLVNQLVRRFLQDQLKTVPAALDPARFLKKG